MLIQTRQHFHYTELDYNKYRKAFEQGTLDQKIADRYGRSLTEVHELSSDPDHGGKTTLSSLLETMVAFELEQDGILGSKIIRGPKQTNLEDGWGRKWDVTTPPYIEGMGFNEKSAIDSILRKLSEFPDGDIGILLDISFLRRENYLNLQEDLKNRLTENQKFLVRQVTVRGVFKSCLFE